MAKLAVNGGETLIKDELKSFQWPPLSDKTADKLKDVYLSRSWSFNSRAEQEFEKRFAEYHGAKHGIFMVNGTVTLECALEALGVGPGDEVIIPALTWIATAMAVRYVGATPVFVDSEPDTLCMNPVKFAEAITPLTRAVIPVHLYSSMADNEKIIEIARKYNIGVIEDCAHMQGGFWNGRGVGSWGEIGSFSFQQSKTLASGEGGICITNDDKLAELLFRCKHIGYSRYDEQGKAATSPPSGLLTHNYRGTAFQAQILTDQLEELPALIERYNKSRDILEKGISDIPGMRLQARGRLASPQGFYSFPFIFDGEEWDGIAMEKLGSAIIAEGFTVSSGNGTYGSVYKHNLFNLSEAQYRIAEGGCPVSDEIAMKRVRTFHHPTMYYHENAELLAEVFRKIYINRDELR